MLTSIFKLVNEEGWHLNEAIHTISEIRQDLRTLMQPRPATTMKGSKGTQGRGKGKGGETQTNQREQAVSSQQEAKGNTGGKKGKGKYNDKRTSGKGGGDMPKHWATEVRGVPTCKRFHTGSCPFPDCKFSHLCPVFTPNGFSCGQKHPNGARDCPHNRSSSG